MASSGRFLAQCFHCAAPGDHLVEHLIYRRLVVGGRFERGKVLKIGEERKRHLGADVGNLQLGHHESKTLHGARPAGAAITDKARRLVVPFAVEKIDGVLERAGDAGLYSGVTNT